MGVMAGRYSDMNGNRRTRFFGRRMPSSPADMVNTIKNIVGNYNNIKGMWCFDKTSGASIYDLSGNDHTITLRKNDLTTIDASTCTPGFSGFAPYLTFDATHVWNTLDHDDFSLTDGAGTDTAGSIIWAGLVTDMTNNTILAKFHTTSNVCEYQFFINNTDKIGISFFKTDNSARIGRYYNTATTSYKNVFITIMATYSGSKLSTGIKIYLNGAQIDDMVNDAVGYTGMSNGTALPASYYGAIANPLKAKASFQSFIKGEALTPAQIKQIDWYLRTWAGESVSAP